MKKVIVLGSDGYIGWSLCKSLCYQGIFVLGIDNYSRRKLVAEVGGLSVIPILSSKQREKLLRENGYDFSFVEGDLTDYLFLHDEIKKFKPDTIFHLGQQPSAPYSMRGVREAVYTQSNNIISTLNLIHAVQFLNPSILIIKIATMGEMGTPNIPISEGWMEIEYKGKKDIVPFPKQPSSFYHSCFDDQTEILTEDGWKLFKDWEGEKVVTVNGRQELEYQTPTNFFDYDYEGKLYRQKNKRLDIAVTPNHRMYVSWGRSSGKLSTPKFKEAWEIKGKPVSYLISAPFSNQEEKEFFELPGCDLKFQSEEYSPSLKIKMDDWLHFLGWWLSEGSVDYQGTNYRVTLYTYSRYEEAENAFKQIGFEPQKRQKNYVGKADKRLGLYLRNLGNQLVRYIPKEFKNLSIRQLKILLKSLMDGDGTYNKNGRGEFNGIYYTSSKRLADDVQEIAIKCGLSANISPKTSWENYEEKSFETKNPQYRVNICSTRTVQANLVKDCSWYEPYVGKVYCLEVPNHTLMVRRNGKPFVSGNSKVFDSINIELACKIWGLNITNVYQGIVFGTRINCRSFEGSTIFDSLEGAKTRFDVDEVWGTCLNRFCAQVVINHPVTVYGKGEQKRGFLPLRDSIQCLTILGNNPAEGYRIVNQFAEVYSINQLASTVLEVMEEMGGRLPRITNFKNPRVEKEEHEYEVERVILNKLGYEPSISLKEEIKNILEDLIEHRELIFAVKESGLLSPKTHWRR